MSLQELREKASRLGIEFGWHTPKPALVRAIQRHQGDPPCFGADHRYACPNSRCPWRADCLKPIAVWRR